MTSKHYGHPAAKRLSAVLLPVTCLLTLTWQNVLAKEPYLYIGNIISRKFHRSHCPYAMVMAYAKRCQINSLAAGRKEGFKPCKFCLPRIEKRVQVRLLNDSDSKVLKDGNKNSDGAME